MTLNTEQFTFAMQTKVCDAFKKSKYWDDLDIHHINAIFEHGQWWIIATMDEDSEQDQMTFAVNDAEGPGAVAGFDFEEV